jgi:hypothetical protein
VNVPSLLLIAVGHLSAQVIQPIEPPDHLEDGRPASIRSQVPGSRPSAATGSQNLVFAKIVAGDGWETAITLLNMGTNSVGFRQFFISPDGTPMTVTFRADPGGEAMTASAVECNLNPGSSLSLNVFDNKEPFREGWALLSYDESQGRLGGYAVIRHKERAGSINFEATVPLSSMQDFSLYVPFDNTQGFQTHLTLVNPASNLSAQCRLTYLSPAGQVLVIDSLLMKPRQQVTIVLPDSYPDLANKTGTVMVEAEINRFSVAGLRYNTASGAIAALPLMNSSGVQ